MSFPICGYGFDGPFGNTGFLHDLPGVYVILDHRAERAFHPVDVGESNAVKTRIESHDRSWCWRLHAQGSLAVAVLYTFGWNEDLRRALEARIRATYALPCGVQ